MIYCFTTLYFVFISLMLSFNLESDVSVKATHVTSPLISAFPVVVKTPYTSTPVFVASNLDKLLCNT